MFDAAIEVHEEGQGYLLGAKGMDQLQLVQLIAEAEAKTAQLWMPLYGTPGSEPGSIDMNQPPTDMLMLGELVTSTVGIAWTRNQRVVMAGTIENHAIMTDAVRLDVTGGANRTLDVGIRAQGGEIARGTPQQLIARLKRTGRPDLRVVE
ncbi:hypothetical protein CKO28_00895 [Rhodovibrio sodomensis]|uniref:Uncharacterized protein n=1 Tax=Rhodovibrio sodomensis TaxID=1088 RepID=A0ABS1D8N2_9PROT|nr:hypothetical protein [Rhodovibrio sodomensis]MBK1666599.1 hypothetical protein [Rhodovibrio sodomensis]